MTIAAAVRVGNTAGISRQCSWSDDLPRACDVCVLVSSPQSPQKSWTPEQEVAALSLKDPGSGGKLTAGRPQALVDRAGSSGGTVEDGASTAMAPVEGVGEKRGRKRGESARTGRGVDGEEKEEGTFDLVFSQLEILRLLQVVLR